MSLESGYTATLIVHRPASRGGEFRKVFEKWEGGKIDTPDTKKRNAITRKETARGGLGSRSNVTLSGECDAEAWALIPALEASAGVDRCTAVRQMVDGVGTAIGNPKTVTGVLKSPEYPDYDLESEAVGMLQVEVSADE